MSRQVPEISMDDPVVVSRAPPGVTGWGPWQFPAVQRLPDGRLQVGYHVAADSAAAYGTPPGIAVSDDDGRSWRAVTADDSAPSWASQTLRLPNGDLLRQVQLKSRKLSEVSASLPPPIATWTDGYDGKVILYPADKMPAELAGYRFARLRKGGDRWIEETATINVPGALRGAVQERGKDAAVLPLPWIQRIRPALDGSLWGVGHYLRVVDGVLRTPMAVYFLRSADQGRTWDLIGEIPYQPDKTKHKLWDTNEGFTEPNIAFLPDGTIFCLIRTLARNPGPSYQSRSTDGGKTWSRPEIFDDVGVWPALVTLRNGATLAAYGRPGLYVRAAGDPGARQWGPRVAVVAPERGTCSYSDLIALDDDSALIVYSDFNCPDEQGKPRKTILTRRVTVK